MSDANDISRNLIQAAQAVNVVNQTVKTGQAIADDLTAKHRIREGAQREQHAEEQRALRSHATHNEFQLQMAEEANGKLRRELQEKQELLIEWMQSSEAFKRVARGYGQRLGLSDEQRIKDYQQMLLVLADEDYRFSKTRLTAKIQAKPVNT